MAIPIVPPSEELPQRVMLTDAIPAPMPAPEVQAKADSSNARKAVAQMIRKGVYTDDGTPVDLTPAQAAYVKEFALSCDHKRAMQAAGLRPDQHQTVKRNPDVQLAIQQARAAIRATYQASTEELIAELQRIALGDARELVRYVYDPCAECWPDERDAGLDVPPTPDPRCNFCRGAGVGKSEVCDTRDLSESGRAMFAGIKQTQHGTYVLTHSKMDAMEKLLKIFGAYEMDNRQKLAPLTELLEYVAANRQGLPIRK